MAFATTNVRTVSFGSVKAAIGHWTGSEGDASGTLTLNGGDTLFINFVNEDATSQENKVVPYSVSTSDSVITITVYNHSAVTRGRFLVIFA